MTSNKNTVGGTTWNHYTDFLKSLGNIENVMLISSEDGGLWSSTPTTFFLKEYDAMIAQEDGTDKSEVVNEAKNLLSYILGTASPAQGLRINGSPKQQIVRNYKDDETNLTVIIGKHSQGGSCIAHAGKCIIVATHSEAAGHKAPGCNDNVVFMARYLYKSVWPSDSDSSTANSSDVARLNDGSASWKSYIDSMLIGKGSVKEAIICSKADGAVWSSSSADFGLKTYETAIANDDGIDTIETVDESKNMLKLLQGIKSPYGLRVNEVKYQVLRSFDEENSGCYTIYGKKSKGGICCMCTNKAVIIATFDESVGHSSSACNISMSDLGKLLMNAKL